MPELPAVEYTKRLLERFCVGRAIKSVRPVFNGNQWDDLIVSPEARQVLLECKRFVGVGRWGKQLWLELDGPKFLLMHLGMTAFVQARGHSRLNYESSPSNSSKSEAHPEWPSRFAKFIFVFVDGTEVEFADARRMGRVSFAEGIRSAEEMVKHLQGKLGFDPILSRDTSLADISSLIGGRRVQLKTLLLDQKFVAGVGNWMADDILLEAGLRPSRLACTLNEKEQLSLLEAIQKISQVAVEAEGQKDAFPRHWLFHIRWKHGKATLTGESVKEDRIGGRSTFWIPERQK